MVKWVVLLAVGLLFLRLLPIAVRFVEVAALSVVRLAWVLPFIALALWAAWALARRPRQSLSDAEARRAFDRFGRNSPH